jgi:hypothetical protein
MKKTILTCDRCKKEVSELIEVGAGKREVHYNSYSYGGGNMYRLYQLSAEWCLDCCIEMHIAEPRKESEAKPIQPPPTLEDFIREIIRKEIQSNT